jgi:hypothetical protein
MRHGVFSLNNFEIMLKTIQISTLDNWRLKLGLSLYLSLISWKKRENKQPVGHD